MRDSISTFVIWITTVVAILFVLSTTWEISASSVGKDCERLGGFYIGHKIYKCEAVK